MRKKYIVRLTDEEREQYAYKIKYATVLLKVDTGILK